MTSNSLPRLPLAVALLVSTLGLFPTGCASKEEIAARRKYETDDERADREVFRENWLIPSVSEEEKDFYYRSWIKR